MKHLFVINATKKETRKEDLSKLFKAFEGLETEVHWTTGVGDATSFLKEYLSSHKEEVIVYAVGGDGTINEVVNGLVGFDHATMAIVPYGTGNDFVKYYGGVEPFLDFDALINGEKHQIDLSVIKGAEEGTWYSVNVVNIGFDALVAELASIYARRGIKNPFNKAIPHGLLHGWHNKIDVYADGKKMNDGMLFLCSLGHGKYYGGQYCCAPHSDNEDGLIEFSLVKRISLPKFLTMVGCYTKGTHLDFPKYRKKFTIARCKHVVFECKKRTGLCVDGETIHGTHFEVDVVPKALNFIVPKKK